MKILQIFLVAALCAVATITVSSCDDDYGPIKENTNELTGEEKAAVLNALQGTYNGITTSKNGAAKVTWRIEGDQLIIDKFPLRFLGPVAGGVYHNAFTNKDSVTVLNATISPFKPSKNVSSNTAFFYLTPDGHGRKYEVPFTVTINGKTCQGILHFVSSSYEGIYASAGTMDMKGNMQFMFVVESFDVFLDNTVTPQTINCNNFVISFQYNKL